MSLSPDQLTVGKYYMLGDIRVGKLVKKNNKTLSFKGSDFGGKGINKIDFDSKDEYVEIPGASPSSKTRKRGGKKNKTRRKRT